MRDVSQLVTQFTGVDPNYPDGKFINDGVPGDNTGSELVESWPNDILGAMYAIIRAAGLTPDGNPEFPGQSQIVTAIQVLSLPVGSCIAWQDFGILSLPSGFLYNNGQVVADALSPINGETLQDLSNRIIVGFGSEGGADIGSVGWTAGAIGNASHQIDLQHMHTMSGHIHTMPTHIHTMGIHSHTVAAHGHDVGTHKFKTGETLVAGRFEMYDTGGANNTVVDNFSERLAGAALSARVAAATTQFFTKDGTGTSANATPATDSVDPGDTNATDPGDTNSTVDIMNNQLSTTQSIQMRSIRMRFITKIK